MSTARAILDAVNIVYGKNVSVILGGHDRGPRSMHRAAVSIDQFPEINAEEYRSFSNPNYSTGYFHWVSSRTLKAMSWRLTSLC